LPIFAGGDLGSIAWIVLGDLTHSVLVITDREAVLVTAAPLRRRRVRVLAFDSALGLLVQRVRHWQGGSIRWRTDALVVRPVNGGPTTWEIGVEQAVYREIVARYQRRQPQQPRAAERLGARGDHGRLIPGADAAGAGEVATSLPGCRSSVAAGRQPLSARVHGRQAVAGELTGTRSGG
jgi:hypothetical protein